MPYWKNLLGLSKKGEVGEDTGYSVMAILAMAVLIIALVVFAVLKVFGVL